MLLLTFDQEQPLPALQAKLSIQHQQARSDGSCNNLRQAAPTASHGTRVAATVAWPANMHVMPAATVLLTRLGVTPQLRGPVPMLADYELACPLAWLTVIPVSITVYGTVVLSAAYQQLM